MSEADDGDDEVDQLFDEACARFEEGRFSDARSLLEEVVELADDEAAWFYLGATLERLGRLGEADAALRRAAELDPEGYAPPFRVSADAFDRVVTEALRDLPEPIARAVRDDCVISREDYPAAARVRREGVDPLLLGECFGTLEEARGRLEGPAQVVLYRRNLEKVCADRDELVDEIRITVFHEVGHALGMTEEEVEAWGLG